MSELKLMIQKAAHLRPKSFRLFSNGEEYTNFNDETFESLFHAQKIVVFTLDIIISGDLEETELLLQMKCPCNIHNDKFLLYYCFTCGQSICCECFTHGVHQGHNIQDKCFYLLPSKFLVDKLFENWNNNPDEYKFSEDQTLEKLRKNINTLIFDKLFETLKNIQNKVANILEQYHYINYQSFEIIRNSNIDIKRYSIKLLDELKEMMNIEEIINDDQIFLDFDEAYKKLARLKNEKYKYRYSLYTEFNQIIPGLVKNMINEVNDKILSSLNQIVNDQRFDNILSQMKMRCIKSFEKTEIDKEIKSHIMNKYGDSPRKRYTINNIHYKNVDNTQERKTFWPNSKTITNLTFGFNDNDSNVELQKNYYDNLINLGTKIYNIIYDPYDFPINQISQKSLLNMIYTIANAFNNKLFEIKTDYQSKKTEIDFSYRNAKDELNPDSYKIIKQKELELSIIIDEIIAYDKNIKIILRKRDNSTDEITLSQLKNIIEGSEIKKQIFYNSTRGYLITEYGIEEGKFEESNFFKHKIKDQMPSLFKTDDLIKQGTFYFNNIHDDSIDNNKCDILFMVDSTISMKSYLAATIDNCVKIAENINKKYNSKKELRFGEIFYRDPFDQPSIKQVHSIYNLTFNKDEFQNLIKTENVSGGGGSEDRERSL